MITFEYLNNTKKDTHKRLESFKSALDVGVDNEVKILDLIRSVYRLGFNEKKRVL